MDSNSIISSWLEENGDPAIMKLTEEKLAKISLALEDEIIQVETPYNPEFVKKILRGREELNDLPYVKTKPLTPYRAKVLEDMKDSIDELNLVLSGKMEARDADELLNEL